MAHAGFHGTSAAEAGALQARPHQSAGYGHETAAVSPALSSAALGLPQLFSPAQAAEILRGLGLTEMTECAIRTRAYRRQIPFHLNGRQIRFTIDDLREIAEGQPLRPSPPASTRPAPATAPRHAPTPRRSSTRTTESPPIRWRARESSRRPTPTHENQQ